MKIRFLGQFFLRQTGLFTEGTNVSSEISSNFADFRHKADKQEVRTITIV